MRAMTFIILVAAILALLPVIGCQTPQKAQAGDATVPGASLDSRSEPTWTIGWSQLKAGMDAVEVLSLLDKPKHVEVTKVNTTWYYSERRPEGPHVVFDTRRMRVDRWRAP